MDAINAVSINTIPSNIKNDFNNIINNDYSRTEEDKNKNNETNFRNSQDFDEKHLKKIETDLNNVAASLNFDLSFQVHKDSGKMFVKIIDKNTHKVIKEIPPESTLDFLSKFEKMLGVLFDKAG